MINVRIAHKINHVKSEQFVVLADLIKLIFGRLPPISVGVFFLPEPKVFGVKHVYIYRCVRIIHEDITFG